MDPKYVWNVYKIFKNSWIKITTQYWLDNLQNNTDDLILYFKFVFIKKDIRVIEKAIRVIKKSFWFEPTSRS